jgi:hypothetical protein
MKGYGLPLIALLAGCAALATAPDARSKSSASPGGSPDRVQVLGAIAGFNHDDPRITVTQQDGAVTVRVTTYGGGCHSKGPTHVQVQGMEALVIPYDYTAPPGTPCTLILLGFVHEATLRFDGRGTGRVRVRGMDHSTISAANPRGDTITVERSIAVP